MNLRTNLSLFLITSLILYSPMVYGQAYRLNRVAVGSDASFRGLSVVDDRVAWISGSKGTVGRSTDGGYSWQVQQASGYEKSDFRSLYAFDDQRAVIANAGSPGAILRTEDGGKNWETVYTNNHPDIFFDGMDFWNDQDGLIYGDPIEGKMVLLRTSDGGKTWKAIDQAPSLEKGEASFAASGTGIRCIGKKEVVICTGGLVSRFWMSSDAGEHFTSLRPPIIQGKPTAGILSAAVQGNKIILVGGDFQDLTLAKAHHLYSVDQGKTWLTPTIPVRAYRECVEYISRDVWIAVGPSGAEVSVDGGEVWHMLSDEKGLHVIRKARKGKLIVTAGSAGAVFLIRQ